MTIHFKYFTIVFVTNPSFSLLIKHVEVERLDILDFTSIILQIVLLAIPILIAVTFHELAHGFVAYKLGDPTAKIAGRLTLNPIKHLDPIGTLVFLFTRMIGWAKPVPVNPYNLRNPRKDMIWVSLAGPATNFIIAILASIIYRTLIIIPVSTSSVFVQTIFIPLLLIVQLTVVINIGIGIFNLIPIPPLDGSTILMGLLPDKHARAYSKIEPYGFIILLGLIFLKVTHYVIFPLIVFFKKLLLGNTVIM